MARCARGPVRPGIGWFIIAWLAVSLSAIAGHAMTPPGTNIPNTARVDWIAPIGGPQITFSNPDSIVVTGMRTPSTTEVLHYAPANPASFSTTVGPEICSTSGTSAGPFIPAPPPTGLGGVPINLAAPVDVMLGGPFHQGEVAFIRVTDRDQDLNPLLPETVVVSVRSLLTGDVEVIELTETGISTGEFVGYLMTNTPPPVSGDCQISVLPGDTIDARYVDPADGTDSSSSSGLVDPEGVVFDSQTGNRIDGVIVRLVDAGTGAPANVFGDDGVSIFPSSVISGGTATDSGGAVYNYGPGEFRFPFVAPGTYRLEISPPGGFSFPSVVGNGALQALPGSPYALGPGSRGSDFIVPLGPAVEVDVPLDPSSGGTGLLLTKQASRTNARIGEFVQYALSLSAPNVGAASPVTIRDRLPQGFRFEPGSLRIGAARAADPEISADGRGLTILTPAIAPGDRLEIRYVAIVGAAARPGAAKNVAFAAGFGARSNTASATVQVAADILEDRSILLGRVRVGRCDAPVREEHGGVPGVRLFLEDGSFVVTDEDGRFHFAGVSADTHVLQLDLDTLPEGLAPSRCPGHSFAGRPWSRFVEPQAGSAWRADFVLERTVPEVVELRQRLTASPRGAQSRIELDVIANGRAFEDVATVLMLPDGVRIVAGSTVLDGHPAEADADRGAVTFRIAQLAAGETARIAFSISREPADMKARINVRAMVKAQSQGAPTRTPVASVEFCGSCEEASVSEAVVFDAGEVTSASATPAGDEPEVLPEDRFDGAWLASAVPATRWLYPETGFNPKIPAIKIGLQHDPRLDVRLLRNGELVEVLNFDGRIRNGAGTTAITRWRGVDLDEGANRFVAELLDAEGTVVERVEAEVHYSGPPVRARFDEEASRLVADGRTAPILAIRLFDRFGRPSREGTTGTFTLEPPYQTAESVAARRTRPLTDLGDFGEETSSYVVGKDGIARVPLQPTTVVGEVRFAAQLADDKTEELEAWLEPGDREWVLVGLGTGTAGYASTGGNDAARKGADGEEDSFTEGRIAFFAKGTVLGKWLLTAAYDSEAERTRLGSLGGGGGLDQRLFQALDPDEHYTLYGDRTEQGHDAPSSGRLYLKVERERFFALYGDFETGLEETELSRYTRSLTGIKTARRGETVRWNAFATDTDQQFLKDELRGRGVSGLYRLRAGNLLVGSEQVVIETRDRFSGQRILETKSLARHVDYDIDYGAGTIHFRQPIPGRDGALNPVFIVVDYEVAAGTQKEITAGGRVAVNVVEDAVEVGATLIHEGGGDLDARLMGADATVQLGENTELKAEYARTTQENFQARSDRSEAWLVTAEHRSEKLEASAYAEQQDAGFGLGQQNANAGATRRLGVEGRYRVSEEVALEGTAYRDENLETGNERSIGEARVDWDDGARGAHAGVRHLSDRGTGMAQETTQLLAGVKQTFFDQRVTLHAATELGFGDEGEHGDFSDRLLLGGDWKVTEDVALFAKDEYTFGDTRSTHDSRVGFRAIPWRGASIESGLNEEMREDGRRTYANLGLSQLWQISQAWALDVSVDRSQTLRGTVAPFDPEVPPAGGTFAEPLEDDYTALSVGIGFNRGGDSFTGRAETRFGDREDQWNLLLGALREEGDIGYSARLEFFRTAANSGERESLLDSRIGMVYRPSDGPFIVLEQLDVEFEDVTKGSFDFRSRRIINHLKVNHEWDRQTQMAWQFSSKWVVDTIDGQRFSSFGNLLGFELRRDLGRRWDIALLARARHLGRGAGQGLSLGYGLSIGRVLVDNVWLSVGYNFAGFYDSEFSRSEYTTKGPFVRVRIKADQETVRQLLGWSVQTSAKRR